MSDGPRDQQPGRYQATPDPADEPTTGPPAGASGMPDPGAQPTSGGPSYAAPTSGGPAASSPTSGGPAASSPTSGDPATDPGAGGTQSGQGAQGPRRRSIRLTDADADTGPEADARKRRRRRLFIAGISIGAALIVIAICAGGLAVISAVSGFREDAAEARESRRLRDAACLALEGRLNRLVPPGATGTPQARAVAVQDENAATRIYVAQLRDQRTGDGWRQLLDARTAYAEALEAQAKSRTPAFYVAPETRDRVPVADELVRSSPDACAGSIRRLAAPDL